MRARGILLPLLLATAPAFAQTPPATGEEAGAAPAARVSLTDLMRQERALEDSAPDKAMAMLREALPRLSPGRERDIARAKLCILTAIDDARGALPIATQGLADARATGDRGGESRFLRCEGYALESTGDPARAAVDYAAAVAAAEAGGDREALADSLTGRGELRQFSGDYKGAIADLDQAYSIDRDIGKQDSQNYVLNAMANLYADPNVGDYDKAIGYYQDLLERHAAAGNRREEATAHFNLGATLDSKHDYAQALVHYRRALDIYKALDIADSVAETRRVIGAILVKQGAAGEAITWIDQALNYYRNAHQTDDVARTQLTRGIALRAAREPRRALEDLANARRYFAVDKNRRFLVRIDEERALAYADLGDWRAAYDALRLQFDAQRDLDRSLADQRTAQLRVQFDAERTEQLNQALRRENASRGAALLAAARERRLQWQVIALAALLLLLLATAVTRQIAKARRLRIQALTDELTGVSNRRSAAAYLRDQMRAASRSHAPLSIVAFDIDHFKRVNDTHGHDAGDRALVRVAALAAGVLRPGDRIGRVGGEEFLLVLPATDAATATEIAERLRQTIAAASFAEVAGGAGITISLGVAAWTPGDDEAALSKRADQALYRAKADGRNRVTRA